jgi:CRISPR-associated protein Cst2
MSKQKKEKIQEDKSKEKEQDTKKYIVLDVVFYGSSLNYDQGVGNYQELKKITKWDGRQYILVSRYALRYSILHWANKLFPDEWKLAGTDVLIAEEGNVARLKLPEELKKENLDLKKVFEKYPEFDLFGFMSAKGAEGQKGKSITRTTPVKISHAISLTPYNYDSQFTANLDIMRRAAGPGAGSNPVTIEEKKDFYVYTIVIDVDRIGKYTKEEHGQKEIGDIDVTDKRNDRIKQLVETIFKLKREIKGRLEDLSPWLVICGLYNDGRYETYADKIELARSHVYKIITKEKETRDNEGRTIKEIENETIEKDAPKFMIDIDKNLASLATQQQIIDEINNFLNNKNSQSKILVYKRQFIQTDPEFESLPAPNK